MKSCTLFFLIVVFSGTVAFAEKPKQVFSINQNGKSDIAAKATAILPKIVKSCPGLDRYAADLIPAVVSIGQSLDDAYDKGIVIEFVVADKPTVLPKPLNLYSMKNHCAVFVSKKEDKMFIAKRACHSICDGIWKENDLGSLGKEYNLN